MPKQKKKSTRNNNTKINKKNPSNAVLPYRGSQLIIQDKQRTCLRFWKSQAQTLSSTVPVISYRFVPSSAYDVDPAVASTAMPGFQEFANLYSSYRVLGSRCTVEVGNSSSTVCELILCPTNQDPGGAPLANVIIAAKAQPYAVSKMVPAVGAPPTKVVCSMTTTKLYGSNMTRTDDKFSSLVTGVPENNWYWFIGLYSQATANSSLTMNFTIDVDLEFYDRKVLLA